MVPREFTLCNEEVIWGGFGFIELRCNLYVLVGRLREHFKMFPRIFLYFWVLECLSAFV